MEWISRFQTKLQDGSTLVVWDKVWYTESSWWKFSNFEYGFWRSFWKLQRDMRGCPKFNLQSPIWILKSVWKLQRFVRGRPKSYLEDQFEFLRPFENCNFVRGCPKSYLQSQLEFWRPFENCNALCVGVQNPISHFFRIKIGGKIHGPCVVLKFQKLWWSWNFKNSGGLEISRPVRALKFQEQWESWKFKSSGSLENSRALGCSLEISRAVVVSKISRSVTVSEFQELWECRHCNNTGSIEISRALAVLKLQRYW